MNKATEILLANVPEPMRSELIRENRATGRTTRLVDELVQDLMLTGKVEGQEPEVLLRVYNRVRNEHPTLPVELDIEACTIELISPEHSRISIPRSQLIASARELGPDATGEQIAEHAGVPRTSINYHFGSLAALRQEAGV